MVIGKEFDVNMESLTPHERDQYREIERELIHPQDYIDLVPVARWYDELPNLYARSKICFLGALIEGKNRSIQEAMCCNTPVICNVEYNQYVRGNTAIVPEGTGLYSYFDAEAWADTIHEILNNYGDFKPRRKYLEGYGRRKFLNTCMDLIPYYKEHLPGYEEGNHHRNMHLDLAVSHHYQVSLMDFLYGKRHWLTHVRGVEQIREVIQKYVEALSAGSDFKTRPGSFFQSWTRPLMGRVDEGVLAENPGYQFEFHYWRAVLSLEFGEGQERILDRLIPDRMVHVYPREVISYLQAMTESLGRKPKVLDVGSGPVSIFGYGVQNNLIDLNAVDPLATQYIEVLDKLGYSLKHSLIKGFGEELSVLFGSDAFDLVWTENAIDHSISPSKVLEEMVKVVRPGGYVFLKCWTREGTFEEWSGLHQHDIYLNENLELVCESNAPDKPIKTLSILNKGLPLELVYSTPPSTEIRSQILMIWKKKPHYGF
ncbi:MAG: methyltransferase domain-containing protein, partial [Cyanobacteria bacterium]|nr:methyltransferase domain-containing protein [Cyanobacteriota bacterium]